VTGFEPLTRAHASCGAKATTLARLMRAGFAVPSGFVLPSDPAEGWRRDLPGALAALGGTRFAVRSSSHAEDGPAASFAGQFRTSLDLPAARVAAEIDRTLASVGGAAAYAAAIDQPAGGPVAVIVQRMLVPLAAGVTFTRHPLTGDPTILIEAVRGLGDQLVSGKTTPQRWQTNPDGSLAWSGTPAVLTARQAHEVAQSAVRVEALLGGGQDVEWAITPDGQLWVLQARPITTTGFQNHSAQAPSAGGVLTSGTPASPGSAQGRLRVISGLDDFTRFAPGEVLVCRATSPAWTPLLARAAAVITETGGVLAHAAIVARELGVPAITDVPAATGLPDGILVVVDGSAGTIATLEDT
jgi:pyruvate, water dikinase